MESNESADAPNPFAFDKVECLKSISLEFDDKADSATLTERYNLADEPISPHTVAGAFEGAANNTDGEVKNGTTSVDTSEDGFIATHTRTDLSDHEGKEGPIYLLLSGAMTDLVAHDPDAAEEWFNALRMQVHRQLHE